MSTVTRWFATIKTQSINDVWTFNFPSRQVDPVGGVDRHTAVFATVTELAAPPGAGPDFPFIGEASLSVRNIATQDNGQVLLWLAVSPVFFNLDARIQFLVCND